MTRFVASLCLLFLTTAATAGPKKGAAEPPQPGDAAIHAYLARLSIEMDARLADSLPEPTRWLDDQSKLRQEFLYTLGLSPKPERSPLNATITGSVDRGDFIVDRLHFQSLPHLYVTANLYRPKNIPAGERLPAVLYVCGHGYKGPEGVKTGYQANGVWLARHGYIVLLVDTLDRGEIQGAHRGLYSDGRRWWHSRGYTPAGVECWNGMRGIDYLVGRADVDPKQIAVTGISGGGASTMWIAAADPRVRVAVPVSGMADLQAYVADDKTDVHCDCMFVYNVFHWPWTRIAALIAPRPLLFVNSDQDTFFPLQANERIINRLKRCYGHLEASDRVDAIVSVGGHAYRRDIRQSIYRFLNTYLKNDSSFVTDSEQDLVPGEDTLRDPIEPKRLCVFGGSLPVDQINTTIDQLFVPIASPPIPAAGTFEAWKQHLLQELRRVTFVALPSSIPAAQPVDPKNPQQFISESGIEFRLWPRVTNGPTSPARILLVVSLDDDTRAAERPDWLAPATREGDATYICQPRGIGSTQWGRKTPPNRIERQSALLGTTVDTGRVYDIAAAAAYLHQQYPRAQIVATGKGNAAILAGYTALFQSEIHSVIAVEPPASHMDKNAPQFLNILRVCDVPEMLGMLAPRPLTLAGNSREAARPIDAVYKRIQEIYDAAGAGNKLSLSVGE